MPNNRRINRRNTTSKVQDLASTKFFKIISILLIFIIVMISLVLAKLNIEEKGKIAEQKRNIADEIDDIYNKVASDYETLGEYKTNKIIRISAVGDILCSDNMQKYGQDYNNIFTDISEHLKDSDVNIGTYETNINDNNKEFANAVYKSGINLVSISSNHSLDNGKEGLENTKDNLEKIGTETVGQYDNTSAKRVKIKEIKGVKIAFLAYTYSDSKNTKIVDGVNVYSNDIVSQDLKYAKENSAFAVVMMHWGNVNTNTISDMQNEQAKFLIDNGANVIIGAHPSTVQKMEIVQNTAKEDCLIAYSLGNYTSDFNSENSNIELVLNIQIFVDKEGKASLYKVDYTPAYMQDYGSSYKENRYKILDLKKEIANYGTSESKIEKNDYNRLIKALKKLREILEVEE